MPTAQVVKKAIKRARQALKTEAYAEALTAFAEAAKAFEALPEPLAQLEGLYLEWAHAYFKSGQPGEALKTVSLYLQHLTVFSPELQERVQYLLAQSHFAYARESQAADAEKARQHFHKALGYHGLSDFQRAQAFYYQGEALLQLKLFKEAASSFDSALHAFGVQGESFWMGMTRLKTGMWHLMQKQVEPAMNATRQAIQDLEGNAHVGEQAVLRTAYDLMIELCHYQYNTEEGALWQAKRQAME